MYKKHTIKIRRATFLGLLFFVVLGFLIINNNHAQAALLNQYNKINGGTLQASEWNNLLADFVTKNNGGDRLDGFYSINTATSSAYRLDINGALRATSITGALSGTLSAANVSAGLFGDNTGGGNYNFPANIGIGIGTTTPPSIITLANDRWVSARNSAGNGYVNIFKVNANDEIEIGGALNIGNFQFPADSGFNTFVDMPVTSASPNDSIQGYVMKIDGDNILSVFSQSDGLGGIKNRRIGINTSTPQFDLDVAGIINATDIYVNGAPYIGSQWTTSGTNIYYNTGNVGIGTTNPSSMLEVAGNIELNSNTNYLHTQGASNYIYPFKNTDKTMAFIIGSTVAYEGWEFISGSTSRVKITRDGNVGIGTTSPQALLDVNGLIKMRSSTITANEDVVNKGYLDSALASTTAGIISQVATSSFWQGSLTGNVYNANTGNVGIGISNPSEKFVVAGSQQDTTFGIETYSSSNADISEFEFRKSMSNTLGTRLTTTNGAYLGSLMFKGTNSVNNFNYGAYILAIQEGNAGTYIPTRLDFTTYSATASNAPSLSINSAGNVGIGTTNPIIKLEVSDNQAGLGVGAFIKNNSATTANSSANLFFGTYSGHNVSSWYGGKIGVIGMNANQDTDITFSNSLTGSNYERMRIKSNGNIGVGTTNPESPIHIDKEGAGLLITGGTNGRYTMLDSSSLRMYATNVSAWAQGFYHYKNDGNLFGVSAGAFGYNPGALSWYYYGGSYTNHGIRIENGSFSATPPLTVMSGGNIGIATTTPDSRLSVSGGNIFINDAAITSGTPKAAITKEYLTSTLDAFNSETNLWKLNGSTLYSSSTDWNVGIGVNSASYPLVVHSDTAGTVAEFRNSVGNVAYINITDNSTGSGTSNGLTLGYNGQAMIHNRENTPMVFSTNDTGRMRIAASGGVSIGSTYVSNDPGTSSLIVEGNLGLGTTNPTTKLDVEGVIRTTTGIIAPLTTGDALYSSAGNNDVNIWKISNAGNSYGFYQKYVGTGSGDANALELWTTGEVNNDLLVYHLRQSGNMGFGTTNPSTAKIVIATSTNGYTLDAGNFKIGNVATPTFNLDAANKSYVDSTIAAATSSITLWGGSTSGNIWNLNSGNVGVGVTNPAKKLHVAGDIKLDNNKSIYGTLSSGGNRELLKYDASNDIYVGAGTANNVYVGNNANRIQMKVSGDDFMSFTTNSAEVMRINHLGNVGIGTTSPIAKLHAVAVNGTDNSGYNFIFDNQDVNAVHSNGLLVKGGANANSANIFAAQDYSGNTDFVIRGDGNVGIGTASPGARLTVKDSGAGLVQIGQLSNSTAYGAIGFSSTLTASNYVLSSAGTDTYLQSVAGYGIIFKPNATEQMRITSNGNVGIGLTNPASKLAVSGGNIFINDASITSGTPKAAITKEYLDSAFDTIVGDNVGSGTTGQTLRHDGTAWVANSLLFNNGTNVGIGTTAPTAKLSILDNTGGSNAIFNFSGNISSGYGTSFSMDDTGLNIGHRSSARAFNLLTGGTPRLTILGGGNVGIGTTAPSTPLTVHAGSHEVLTLQRAGSTNGWGVWSKFRLQNSVSTYVDYGYIGGGITSNTAGAHTGYLGFGTAQAGALVETMRLSSNGSLQIDGALAVDGTTNSYIQGKVGIGATTPTDKLHVVGSARFSDAINNLYVLPTTSLSVEGPFVSYLGRELRLGIYDNAGHRSGFVINNPNNETETAYISTRVGNSERMRLLGNGNVGIGTTTPDSRLSVSGGNIFINDAAITSGTPKAAITKEYLTSALDAFNSESNLWKLNGSNLYASTTNWNVGIGTTNPNTKLQIANTDAASTSGQDTLKLTGVLSASVVGSGPVLRFTDSNGTSNMSSIRGYTFGSGATGLAFETGWNANTIRMVIDNSGNVGIGTTAPGKRLEVFDSDNVQLLVSGWNTVGTNEASGSIQIGDHPTIHGKVQFNGATGAIYIDNFFDNVGGDIHFRNRVSGTPVNSMTIGGDGNVGIGTTNPGSYKLYVNGDTNINGTLTATSVIGPVTGTLNAANVSSGAFGGNTGGGNYSFPGKLSVGTTSVSSAGLLVNGAVEMARTGLFGTYSSSEVQGIWTIGNGYQISTANNDFGSQYGMVYAHTSAGTGGAKKPIAGWGHQILFTNSGNYTAAISLGSGNAYFGGVVGIGTTAPGSPLHVRSASATPKKMLILDTESATDGTASIIHFVSSTDENVGSQISGFRTGSNGLSALTFSTYNSGIQERLRIDSSGNVGIGTTDPGVYRLKVAGDVAITGTLQTQTGSDFAEEFSVLSDLEAGTVVTMAEEGYKSVRAANKAYDSQVVGIVSDNPSIIAGRVKSEKKVVVAMMGVVSVKVSDINGEVRKGDLLTSSSISGYAMKAVDYRPGTIIGKALEDLTGKSGSIKVLVNLQ